jgi:hypothetical protein
MGVVFSWQEKDFFPLRTAQSGPGRGANVGGNLFNANEAAPEL